MNFTSCSFCNSAIFTRIKFLKEHFQNCIGSTELLILFSAKVHRNFHTKSEQAQQLNIYVYHNLEHKNILYKLFHLSSLSFFSISSLTNRDVVQIAFMKYSPKY